MPQGMHSPTVCARITLTEGNEMSLKIDYCRQCVMDFESHKCARTWDRMIDALVSRGGLSRKVAVERCVRKYGKMFVGVIR